MRHRAPAAIPALAVVLLLFGSPARAERPSSIPFESNLTPVPGATFQDARGLVVERILRGQTGRIELSGWPELVDVAGYKLSTWYGRRVDMPWPECWVFFIDDAPDANWAHHCRYVFVKPDLSAYIIRNALTPLELAKSDGEAFVGKALELLIAFQPPETIPAALPQRAAGAKTIQYNGTATNCYAVIISGGYDTNNNHIRYWGDSAFLYSTLTKKYGYTDDHIYALISDGTNPAVDRSDFSNSPTDLDGDGDVDTDYPATYANITNVFKLLKGILHSNDQLLVFTTDHGMNTDGGTMLDSELNLWNHGILRDDQLKAITTNLPCTVMFVMEQCFSGGFVDDLSKTNWVIATAAQYDQESWAGTHTGYDYWAYYWTAAVRGYYPGANAWTDGSVCSADANQDGYVSFSEAFDFAFTNRYHTFDGESSDNPLCSTNLKTLGSRLFMITVPPGALQADHFEHGPIQPSQSTNVSFPAAVRAVTVFQETATNFTNTVTISAHAGGQESSVNSRSTNGWEYPFFAYYHDVRCQSIYLTNELGPARTLGGVSFYLDQLTTQTFNRLTVRLRYTSLSQYPASPVWEGSGWTTVYQSNKTFVSYGYNVLWFTNTFFYNGQSNLMLDISSDNSSYTINARCCSATTTQDRSITYYCDSTYGDPTTWSGTTPAMTKRKIVPSIALITATSFVQTVALTASNFVNGVWTGAVTVLSTAMNACVDGMDSQYHFGSSERFHVLSYPFYIFSEQLTASTGCVVRWNSAAGETYTLLRSTNMNSGFSTLVTGLPASPPENAYTDLVGNIPHAYYRVLEQ